MTRLFVTGTGTGIGKTFVTAALVHHWRQSGATVRAVKPVASGFDPADWRDSDPGILMAAQDLPPSVLDAIAPWRFRAPLSPDIAAAKEGRRISFGDLLAFSRDVLDGPEDHVLIEGVGGVMVPLNADRLVLDWISALGIATVLVAGSYLGTISHTLTALRVLASAAIPVRAVILSETPGGPAIDDTAGAIRRFRAVPIRILPFIADSDWRKADLGAI